jgi:hypothetical protein
MWSGADSVVIEIEASERYVHYRGPRVERGLGCAQFDLNEGVVIQPHELRRVPEEELCEHRKYLESLETSRVEKQLR